MKIIELWPSPVFGPIIRKRFGYPFTVMPLEHPALFRLYAQEYLHPGSPIGEQARRLRDELRSDLAEDLVRLGLPAATAGERQQVEMIAESMIVQTEALGLAYLDGRYDDLEAIVDVLTRFAVGVLGLE